MKRNARASTRGSVSGFLRQAARLYGGLLSNTLACSAGFLCGAIVQSLIAHCFELYDLQRRLPDHILKMLAKRYRAASTYVLRTRVVEVYGGVRIGNGGHRPPCVGAPSIRSRRPSRNRPSEDPSRRQMPSRNPGRRARLLAHARWGCTVVYGLAMAATDRRVLRRHPSGRAGHPGTGRQRTRPASKCRAATPDVARDFSRARWGCTVVHGLRGGGC